MNQQAARILLCVCLAWSACTDEAVLDQQASRICSCLQPVDSLNQLFASRIQQGEEDEAVEILLDLSEASELAGKCLRDIPDFSQHTENAEVVSRLNTHCPDWKAIVETLPQGDE
ncbi:MAG: hypothetical protein H6568_05055 [Lewinellaceae bacterium]|nr:hypothetical protein [Saprospiraceae bacterium]MCB9312114.1 hypothetical protein [Lewinellaceae bacterium]